jgi:carboxypeptidase family protein
MKRLVPTAIALLMLISIVNAPAIGQSSTVTISGTVSDASRNTIPGVTVTLVNLDTNTQLKTLTDEKGAYQCSNLQPGSYDLNASLPGFQTATISNVKADAGQMIRMNFTLQIGGPSRGPLNSDQVRDLPRVGKCS